jgi:hypothetical protein
MDSLKRSPCGPPANQPNHARYPLETFASGGAGGSAGAGGGGDGLRRRVVHTRVCGCSHIRRKRVAVPLECLGWVPQLVRGSGILDRGGNGSFESVLVSAAISAKEQEGVGRWFTVE